jgi:citrate lyase subunit beta / citryl-CoA lyase
MSALRSLLIMPANRADMLAKAPSYGADALVFDLEDSVPIAEKSKARELAREFIGRHRKDNTILVRVNALQTGLLEDDLDAVAVEGLHAVRVSKTESPETIRTVDRLLGELERKRGLPPGSIGMSPSIESAKGAWFVHDILSASPRVRSVMCGTAQDGDLQADLGYQWTAEGNEVLYVRSRVLLAARAAGVENVLDGAYSNFRDPEGLRVCCEAVRKLGYRGKLVIHPSQVDIVNRAFMPTEKELEYYRRVIEAFDAAVARGSAATSVDGKLVDYAMVETAKRVLAWGERTKATR